MTDTVNLMATKKTKALAHTCVPLTVKRIKVQKIYVENESDILTLAFFAGLIDHWPNVFQIVSDAPAVSYIKRKNFFHLLVRTTKSRAPVVVFYTNVNWCNCYEH